MDAKVFKTYDQQLEILRDRGMIVPEDGMPKQILEKVNYYNLINGYNQLFISTPVTETTPEQYRTGTEFAEIYALYNFDNEMKSIILKRILRIENTLKSEIAYHFSKRYGHDNYLKTSNFELLSSKSKAGRDRIKGVIKLISSIQHQISKNIHNRSIQHYVSNHGYIPLWVLVNILTLGTISFFYEYMTQQDRQTISRLYSIQDDEMINLIKVLTLSRNQCAHDEIFYNFRSRVAILNNPIHHNLNIPSKSGTPICGKHDLLAVLIAIKVLVPSQEFKKMITEIQSVITCLEMQLKTITINDVYSAMGFPSNWEDIKVV